MLRRLKNRSAFAVILLVASSTIAAAQPSALFGQVDPELRPIASAIARAQATRHEQAIKPPASYPALPTNVTLSVAPPVRGTHPVPIYVVNPPRDSAAPARGAILFIHGGGFIAGDAREDIRRLASLASRLDCVIVSVQYRLAPDTKFPGSLEDNYAALKWLSADAPALKVDRSRLILMGESAGGGHAAMLALAARDRGEIPIAFQALIYPMLDDRTGSSHPVAPTIGTLIWRAADNRKGWSALLGRPAGAKTVPAGAVPARARSLVGLPPTFIGVGSIDLFAEEDIEYARRLVAAGVPTELLVLPGAFHGFQLIAPGARVSKRFNEAIEAALARALAPKSP